MKVTFGGNEVHLKGRELKAGENFPEFELTGTDLKTVTLKDIKLPAIILTFPSVDTSVCSLELLTFNDKLEGYKGISCYGVSVDLPFAQDRWVKTNAGDFITMLSDYKTRDFGIATGTLVEDLMILARAAYIVDKDGKVVYDEMVPEIGSEPNYDKILEEAKKLI